MRIRSGIKTKLFLTILVAVLSDFNARTEIYDGTNLLGFTSLPQHHMLIWKDIDFGEHALVAIHRAATGPITSSVVRVRVAYGGYAAALYLATTV